MLFQVAKDSSPLRRDPVRRMENTTFARQGHAVRAHEQGENVVTVKRKRLRLVIAAKRAAGN